MRKLSKPSAAERTVDLFTGQTQAETAKVAIEEPEEAPKGSETIEQAAERWRNNAFYTAELFSKHSDWPNGSKYRLTRKDNLMFLEKFQGPDGNAYHWSGVMFDYRDLQVLTEVFVKAYRGSQ